MITEPKYTGTNTDFYVASEEIAETVNLAIDLRRPILVEGEPGSGKTKLADSIAAEKNLGKVIKIVVRSTSRAQDLLYQVNSLKRFQEAQIVGNEDAKFVYPYLSLGPLGDVIQQKERRVVLIDEIDKADIDFPNDLLDVLDNFEFQVGDLPSSEEEASQERNGFGKVIKSDEESIPIVVITSNQEKRLPEAFLRRCLYIHLRFPDDSKQLEDIVRKNTRKNPEELNQELLETVVDSFKKIRAGTAGSVEKLPSTSELIDWVKILYLKGTTIEDFKEKAELPPYWKTLFKSINDIESYRKAVTEAQKQGPQ